MPKNVACTDNLNKQKIPPTLKLFCVELNTALENEYGDAVKGAQEILRMANDYAVQLLLTLATSKVRKITQAMVFTYPENIRLIFFERSVIDYKMIGVLT